MNPILESHHYQSGSNANSEAIRALEREGLNPHLVLDPVLRGISLADKFKSINWVKGVDKFSDIVASPIDKSIILATDLVLNTMTATRKAGSRKNLQSWDKWYEEQGHSIKKASQKQIITEWLADCMVPNDVLDNLEKARPGAGETHKKLLQDVAGKLIYNYPRAAVTDYMNEFADGFSTISNVAVVGIGETLISPVVQKIYKSMEKSWQGYWSVYYTMSADLNNVFGDTKTELNPETQLNELLHAFDNEYDFGISNITQYSTMLGLASGVGLAMFAKEGPKGLLKAGAMITTLGLVARKAAGSIVNSQVQPLVDRTADIQNEVRDLYEARERWQGISRETGIDDGILDRIEVINELRGQKNVFEGVVEKGIKRIIAVASALWQDGSFAGGSMIAASLWFSAQSLKKAETNYKYYRKLKEKSLKKIRCAFDEQSGERGILRNEVGSVNEIDKSSGLTIKLSKLELPGMGASGKETKLVTFQPGYTIDGGEIIPIFGNNRSGKTTTMKTLVGDYSAGTRSKITINGQSFLDLTERAKKKVFRWIGKGGASDAQFNLKQVIAELLYEFPNNQIIANISRDRLKNWSNPSSVDEELEKSVVNYIKQYLPTLSIDESWFRDVVRMPSGMEKAKLSLVLNMAIDEPVILLMDEVGGEMTDEAFAELMAYFDSVDFGNKTFMPIVNVRKNAWIEHNKVTKYINLNDSGWNGNVLTSLNREEAMQSDRVDEIWALYRAGKPISPNEISYWLRHGNVEKEIDKNELDEYFLTNIKNWSSIIPTIRTPGQRYSIDQIKYASHALEAFLDYSDLTTSSSDNVVLKNTREYRTFSDSLDSVRFISGSSCNVGYKQKPAKIEYVTQAIIFTLLYDQLRQLSGHHETGMLFTSLQNAFNFDRYTNLVMGERNSKFYQNSVVVSWIIQNHDSATILRAREQIAAEARELKGKQRTHYINSLKNISTYTGRGKRVGLWETLDLKELDLR